MLNHVEKTAIVHEVLVGLKSAKDVASNHNIKPQLVMSLVSKVKTNKKYLQEIANREDIKQQQEDAITSACQYHIDQQLPIQSSNKII